MWRVQMIESDLSSRNSEQRTLDTRIERFQTESEPEIGLFLEPEPGDFKSKAFLTLLSAVEVRDR
jgi:hypothetical protein